MTPRPRPTPSTTTRQYQNWLETVGEETMGRGKSYLYDEPQVRFDARPNDLIVCSPGIRVVSDGKAFALTVPGHEKRLALNALNRLEVSSSQIQAIVTRLDGTGTLSELKTDPVSTALLDAIVQDGLGLWLFVPLAIFECEKAVAGAEITRFPGSPYEVQRSYWSNMGAVRKELSVLGVSLQEDQSFGRLLQRLHRIALMGTDGDSFYQPASRIGRQKITPGQFHTDNNQLQETSNGTLIIRGLRVGAPPVGGKNYHHLLYRSVHDPLAYQPREHIDAQGLSWGRCIAGRTVNEQSNRPWFCPPRPILPTHLSQLRRSIQAAWQACFSNNVDSTLQHLARFHQRFVQLHPFACANQSVAMSIVNYCLNQLLGAGLPHLILDQLALRLSSAAYPIVFRRAVRAYGTPGLSVAERHTQLAQSRSVAFFLSAQLEQCPHLEQASKLAAASGPDRKLLLLP